MATIAEIRQQYPQYSDMSDQELADAMYKTHYSDMPRDTFNQKIGFNAASSKSPSLLSQAGSAIGNAAVGAGTELYNEATGVNHLLSNAVGLGKYAPQPLPQPQTAAGQAGALAGGTAAYMLPGGIAKGVNALEPIANSLLKSSNILSKLEPTAKASAYGSLFSGATSPDDDRLKNAVIGGAIPAATDAGANVLAKPVNAIGQMVKKTASKFAAPSMVNEAVNAVSKPTISNEQAFDIAKNNYDAHAADEKNKWDVLKGYAQVADVTPGIKFDNSDYVQSLEDKASKLSLQSTEQSGFARKNKDSIDLLNDYKNDNHGTFSTALEHNQALNADYGYESTPGKSLPFETIKYSLGNLKNSIKSNIEDNRLQDTLGTAFTDANKATQDKKQIFNSVVSPKGVEQRSSFINFINQNNPWASRGNFVNDYLPSGTKESLERMQQFSKMIGSEDVAKDIIKNNYFDVEKGLSGSQFLNKYDALNNDEKQFLFNKDEINKYNKLSSVVKKDPSSLKQPGVFDLTHSALGTGLGALGGLAVGHNAVKGGLAGLVAANSLKLGASKAMSYPALRNSLLRDSIPRNGFIGNRMPLTNALTNAIATNDFGGGQ